MSNTVALSLLVVVAVVTVATAIPDCDSRIHYPINAYISGQKICPVECIKYKRTNGARYDPQQVTRYVCCDGNNVRAYPNNIYNMQRKCEKDDSTQPTTSGTTASPSSTTSGTTGSPSSTTSGTTASPSSTTSGTTASPSSTTSGTTAGPTGTTSSSIPRCDSRIHYRKRSYISGEQNICKVQCARYKSTNGASYFDRVVTRYQCCSGYTNVKAYPGNYYNHQRKCVKN